jgi:hypothetical protein
VRLHVRLQHVAAAQADMPVRVTMPTCWPRATARGCEKRIGILGYRIWWQPRVCRGEGLLCGVDRARDPPCTLAAHMVQVVSAIPPAIHRLKPAVSALLLQVILTARLRAWLAMFTSARVLNVVYHADFTWQSGAACRRCGCSPEKRLISAAWRANAHHLVHFVADIRRECDDAM